jgi:hypothetical protein
VYAKHFEGERRRLAEKTHTKRTPRKKQRFVPEKEVLVGIVKKTPPKQPQEAKQQEVVSSPTEPSDAEKIELKELSQQLALNRRLSISLKRSLVQQAVVNAATKRQEEEEEQQGDEETTSLDSNDSEEKNTSMATAVLADDDLPKRNLGTDDSEIEMVDALADRRFV